MKLIHPSPRPRPFVHINQGWCLDLALGSPAPARRTDNILAPVTRPIHIWWLLPYINHCLLIKHPFFGLPSLRNTLISRDMTHDMTLIWTSLVVYPFRNSVEHLGSSYQWLILWSTYMAHSKKLLITHSELMIAKQRRLGRSTRFGHVLAWSIQNRAGCLCG